MAARTIQSLYAGKCRDCGGEIEINEVVWYDGGAPRGKKTWHVDCENSKANTYRRTSAALTQELYEHAEKTLAQYGAVQVGAHVRCLVRIHHEGWFDDRRFDLQPGDEGVIERVTVGDASTSYHGVSWQVKWLLNGGQRIEYSDVYPNGQVEVFAVVEG